MEICGGDDGVVGFTRDDCSNSSSGGGGGGEEL